MTVRVLLFAYLRERCGAREVTVTVPEGAAVADLWRSLAERFPPLADQRLRFAVNQVYVDSAHVLHENDEIALIPPVSGGSEPAPGRRDVFQITDGPIDTAELLRTVAHPGAGGTVLFVGTTRDENEGRVVTRLEYETYENMATAEMRKIGDEITRRWAVVAVAMAHRIGVVPIGEASVAIAVSAAHREEAFAACRHGIDTLKATVPIWKKEHCEGGAHWVAGCDHEVAAPREGRGHG